MVPALVGACSCVSLAVVALWCSVCVLLVWPGQGASGGDPVWGLSYKGSSAVKVEFRVVIAAVGLCGVVVGVGAVVGRAGGG